VAYDILVLTDHRLHTTAHAVYAFSAALASHPSINSVDIASRGLEDNGLFFDGSVESILSVIPAIPRLTFRRAKQLFETGITESELQDYDFVFMDLPHPFPHKLFHALSEVIPEDHIINEPSGIIRTASLAFLQEFADCCPPMGVIRKRSDLTEFLQRCPVTILQPLFGSDESTMVKVTQNDAETTAGKKLFHRPFFQQWSPPYLAMEYQPGIRDGVKRTLVVNGVVTGSLLHMPPEGAWSFAGTKTLKVHARPEKEDLRIAERILPALSKHGIVHFSFDTIRTAHRKRILTNVNIQLADELRLITDAQGKKLIKQWIHEMTQYMDRVWFGNQV
jgi:glutathione synthase